MFNIIGSYHAEPQTTYKVSLHMASHTLQMFVRAEWLHNMMGEEAEL